MKAIALIRVSTLNQDLSQQTDTVINEMIKDGYSKDDIILIEDKESAVKLDEEQRLGITKLKAEILDDPSINAVYIFELSRLSRRPEILYSVRDFLINHNIQLVVLKPYMKLLDVDGKLSQTASIMFGIFGALAEQEGYLRKERMHRGVLAKKAQGKYTGGRLPFGYTIDTKTREVIVDEERANVVRRMFKMYVEDDISTRRIAKYFNETGELKVCDGHATVQTAVNTICSMLKNKSYVGQQAVNNYTKKEVLFIYPRIISDELFEAAQLKFSKAKNAVKKSKHVHLCKGLIKDSNGNTMTAIMSSNLYKVERSNFDGNDYKFYAPMTLIDSLVWHFVKQFNSINTPAQIADTIRKYTLEITTLKKKVHTLTNKILEYEAQMLKINERIISGRLKESIGDSMLDKINAQVKECQIKIIEHQLERQHFVEVINRLKSGNTTDISKVTDFQEMADIIHDCVKEVVVSQSSTKGIYYLEIFFNNSTSIEITMNSYKRSAIDSITCEPIEFEYIARTKLVVKDGVKKNVIVC